MKPARAREGEDPGHPILARGQQSDLVDRRTVVMSGKRVGVDLPIDGVVVDEATRPPTEMRTSVGLTPPPATVTVGTVSDDDGLAGLPLLPHATITPAVTASAKPSWNVLWETIFRNIYHTSTSFHQSKGDARGHVPKEGRFRPLGSRSFTECISSYAARKSRSESRSVDPMFGEVATQGALADSDQFGRGPGVTRPGRSGGADQGITAARRAYNAGA